MRQIVLKRQLSHINRRSPFCIPFIVRAGPFRRHQSIHWQLPPFGTILTLGPLMIRTVKTMMNLDASGKETIVLAIKFKLLGKLQVELKRI